MKKLLTILFLLICILVHGEQISLDKAKQVAINFLTVQSSGQQKINSKTKIAPQLSLTQVTRLLQTDNSIHKSKSAVADTSDLYIFNVNDNQGFIVISGNDVTIPVLAYTDQGKIETGNVPDGLMFFLNSYSEQLKYLKDNPIVQSSTVNDNWSNLMKMSVSKSVNEDFVEPLTANIKWGQGTFFNYGFPFLDDSKNIRAISGCVATALAQILKKWEYPKQGYGYYSYYHNPIGQISGELSTIFGNTTYDWRNMPGDYTGMSVLNSDDLIKIKSVSNVMLQCGRGVNMNYTITNGQALSLAPIDTARRVLIENFGYSESIQYIEKVNYSDPIWEQKIQNELKNGRVILYGGRQIGVGGHAFICDGFKNYNNSIYYNFNWGRQGEGNCYCALNSLIPESTQYNFTDSQVALIGIQPKISNYFDLKLNKFSFGNFNYNNSEKIDIDVANNDSKDFSGTIYIAVFNKENKHLLDIQECTNLSINDGETISLSFNYSKVLLLPNSYTLGVFYKTDGFNGVAIGDGLSNNFANVNVLTTFSQDIIIAEPFTLSKNPIIKDAAFSVTATFKNNGSFSYSGTVGLGVFDNSNLIKVIDEKQIQNLVIGYTNITTFQSNGINLNPGNYLFGIYRKTDDGNVIIVDPVEYSTKYLNVILSDDQYEPNNSFSTAYLLTLSDNGSDNYKVTTSNANILNNEDVDYYKIELPTGSKYTIKANLYDSNNQNSTNDLTCDVLCRMYYNSQWHDQFDSMSSDITIDNGGTIYFLIEPKDEFQNGSYILDINVQKDIIAVSTISGKIFNDINNNGVFDVGIDSPQSAGWSVQIQGVVTQTITPNADGTYSFSNLPTGTYTVSEIVPTDWTVLSPYWSGKYTVDISVGDNIVNKDFANFYLQRNNSDDESLYFPNGLNTANHPESQPIPESNIPVNSIHLNVSSAGFKPDTLYIKKDYIVQFALTSTDGFTHVFYLDNPKFQGTLLGVAGGETRMKCFKTYNVLSGEIYRFTCDIPGHSGLGEIGYIKIIGNTIATLPAQAGSISGLSTVNKGQNNVQYSVDPIANATGYVWSVPSGVSIVSGNNTNIITVNFSVSAVSGNFSVYGTNSVGNGNPSPNFAVAVMSLTGVSTISGKIFNDINNNGVFDVGIDSPQSAGWSVQIQGIVNQTITPNADGTYSFSNLPTGLYTVSEIVPDNWTVLSPYWGGKYTIDLTTGGNSINKDFANFYLLRDNSDTEYLHFPNGQMTGDNTVTQSSQFAPLQSGPINVNDLPVNVIHLNTSNSTGFQPNTFYVMKNQIVQLSLTSTDQWAHGISFDDAKLQAVGLGVYGNETRIVTFKTNNFNYGDKLNFHCIIPTHVTYLNETGCMIIKDYVPPTPTISRTGNVLHSDAVNGNQWYNQNGEINGATSQDYMAVYNGDYYCIVTLMGSSSNKSNSIIVNELSKRSISGKIFNDLNNNGIFDGNDAVQSAGWKVRIEGPVNTTITPNADGTYMFDYLPIGIYTVSEIMPNDWTVISPYEAGKYTVDLSNEENVAGKNFSNFYLQRNLTSNIEYLPFPYGQGTGQNDAAPMTTFATRLSSPILSENLPVNSIEIIYDGTKFEPNTFYIKKDYIVQMALTSKEDCRLVFDNLNLSALELPVPTNYTLMKTFKSQNLSTGDSYVFRVDIPGRSNITGRIIVIGNNLTAPIISRIDNVLRSDVVNGNQWYNQSGKISGATNQDYTVTENGDYYCGLTLVGSGIIKSNTINVNNLNTDLKEVEKFLNIYQNLSGEFVHISGFGGKATIKLINISGVEVFSKLISNNENISLNKVVTGVYLVRIITNEGVTVRKIIKK